MERKYNNRANGQMETESVKRIGIYSEAMDKCTISKETACLIACYVKADKLFNEIRDAYVMSYGDAQVAFGGYRYTDEVEKTLEGYKALDYINEVRYALVQDIGAYIKDKLLMEGGTAI